MKKLMLGKTGLMVSAIAMGGIPIMRLEKAEAVKVIRAVVGMGINFIDTANSYVDSEEKIGEALKPYRREDVIIASKSAARDKAAFLKHVQLSLKRLNTSYLDIHYLHGVNTTEDMEKVMGDKGAYQGLAEAVRDGKIRHMAFSSHSLDTALKMVRTDKFEVLQFPFNFVERKAAEKLIPEALKRNMGFIAMKPLGGGMLSGAKLAFRFLSQYENIVPDPGIERIEEMQEILEISRIKGPLSEPEKKQMADIESQLGKQWCRRCGYCQPCPQEIPINTVLATRSILKRMSLDAANHFLEQAMEAVDQCTECEQCIDKCPYQLDIPRLLKKNKSIWLEHNRKI